MNNIRESKSITKITLRYRKNVNTQLVSLIIFYVFLAAEFEFNIRLSPSRLYLAVKEVDIFAFFNRKLKEKHLRKS